MRSRIVYLFATFVAIVSQGSTSNDPNIIGNYIDQSQGKKLVCYYTNWSQYRKGQGKFMPENIPANLCTHIIYAFAKLDNENKLTTFEWNDEEMYKRIMKLKKENRKLKILLAVGGATFGSAGFKNIVGNSNVRNSFISHAINFLRQRQFDGLDLDWEYPEGSQDKAGFTVLVEQLRKAFEIEAQKSNKERLLLSAAVPVNPDRIVNDYDVPAIATHLDFINVMAYDFHGSWDASTGHNAPLFSRSTDSEFNRKLSVDYAAKLWADRGAPKEKLIIGMPTYGRSFTLADPNNNGLSAPAHGGGTAGAYSGERGILAYYEICKMLLEGATYKWDNEIQVPYLVKGKEWVCFDDERSIRNKMEWLKKNDYGGAMVWTLDFDDFTGTMCKGNVKYPLIGIMSEVLLGNSRGESVEDINWSDVPQEINYQNDLDLNSIDSHTETYTTNDAYGITCKEGELLKASSCNQFYICDGAVKHLMNCSENLAFSATLQVCDWPENVEGCH